MLCSTVLSNDSGSNNCLLDLSSCFFNFGIFQKQRSQFQPFSHKCYSRNGRFRLNDTCKVDLMVLHMQSLH